MSFPAVRPKAQPAPSPRIRVISTERRYLGFHISNREESQKEVARIAALKRSSI